MESATRIGLALLERLSAQAAANRAAGDRLRAEVRAVLDRHPGQHLCAKDVLRLLMHTPLPSVRRVQEVLREVRVGAHP